MKEVVLLEFHKSLSRRRMAVIPPTYYGPLMKLLFWWDTMVTHSFILLFVNSESTPY